MPRFIISLIAAWLGALLLLVGPVFAHGAFMDVAGVNAVEIHARYDTDEPMAEAQIIIYAPDNPAVPWLTGVADSEGRFVFVPDDRPGRWAIQARQAGHGAMNYFTLEAGGGEILAVVATAQTGPDLMQRLLMIACVVWGCIGTALYFRRKRKEAA